MTNVLPMRGGTIPLLSKKDRYCIEICRGKCCYLPGKRPCPNLGKDFKCKIHDKWKDNWCHFEIEGIKAMPIKELLKNRLLPDGVIDNCCYAHPELLERLNGK